MNTNIEVQGIKQRQYVQKNQWTLKSGGRLVIIYNVQNKTRNTLVRAYAPLWHVHKCNEKDGNETLEWGYLMPQINKADIKWLILMHNICRLCWKSTVTNAHGNICAITNWGLHKQLPFIQILAWNSQKNGSCSTLHRKIYISKDNQCPLATTGKARAS